MNGRLMRTFAGFSLRALLPALALVFLCWSFGAAFAEMRDIPSPPCCAFAEMQDIRVQAAALNTSLKSGASDDSRRWTHRETADGLSDAAERYISSFTPARPSLVHESPCGSGAETLRIKTIQKVE